MDSSIGEDTVFYHRYLIAADKCRYGRMQLCVKS